MSLKQNQEALDAIAFAECVLTLLDEGAYNTTYKFSVLLGLMDLVIEQSTSDGTLARMITTKQLAEKIIEIYWHHTTDYGAIKGIPLQGKSGQAKIVRDISAFRVSTQFSSLFSSKTKYPKKYTALVNKVEKTTIEMPLPRVQYFGSQENRFIYDVAWSKENPVDLKQVTLYQRGDESTFDNSITLLPHVADYFVNLNGLLRPLIQRTWALEVAKINQLEESKLENFLFGAKRAATAKLAEPLREIQNDRCFYCGDRFAITEKKKPAVDHFIPWVRYPNDGLCNYVLAHSDCNGSKSDHLADVEHFAHWIGRNNDEGIVSDLKSIAKDNFWDLRQRESINIAKNIYLRLQPELELWSAKDSYMLVDVARIKSVVGAMNKP